MSSSTTVLKSITDANNPVDPEGRTYHLAVKHGEVANRIVCVGDLGRAEMLSTFLDKDCKLFTCKSSRGFAVFTGKYKGVPLSIIGTGMGCPMIDFTIRETRAILTGKMVMARFGTCGTPTQTIGVGNIVVADSSVMIHRNPAAFYPDAAADTPAYLIDRPIPSDPKLVELLHAALREKLGSEFVHLGLNATADSFYASQGRTAKYFNDRNETFFDDYLLKQYPQTVTLEMETFHLLDMARVSKPGYELVGAAAALILAQRQSGQFIDMDTKHRMEREAGIAVMEAVAQYPLTPEETMSGSHCVWQQ